MLITASVHLLIILYLFACVFVTTEVFILRELVHCDMNMNTRQRDVTSLQSRCQ